jgi:hypothetical protein
VVQALLFFSQDILKVGSEDLVFKSSPAIDLLTMLITAYVPLSRNAGMKLLTAIFGFGICIIVFGLLLYFGVSLAALFFEWCVLMYFGCYSSNDLAT